MTVVPNVLSISHEPEARVMTAVITRREVFTKHAGHLVYVMMYSVVRDLVDSRCENFITRLIDGALDFSDCGHSGLL